MTEATKLSNRLKQTWSNTNSMNWDAIECDLRSAKNMINKGEIDSNLIDIYLVISEAFNREFGVKLNEK